MEESFAKLSIHPEEAKKAEDGSEALQNPDPEPIEDRQIIARFTPKHTKPLISCCACGKPMESNGFSTCNECIALSVDITSDLPHTGSIQFCKNCGRVKVPPGGWQYAERESRELMAILLRRLKISDAQGVRFVDARFIWTEPHSRRTKITVTVQGEATQFNNLIIQQSYPVEFFESTTQCPECAKSYTANKWVATIQVRQKTEHKKTFLYLEQLILKNKAHQQTMSIEEKRDGIDFFYSRQADAAKMLEFLQSVVPIRSKRSEQFISEDTHTGTKSYKFTYSVEIVPICREDLVVLPRKVARQHGNIPLLTLCYKVNKNVHLIDPNTLQTTILTAQQYFKDPFTSVASGRALTEFIVLDIEPTGPSVDKFALADVTIARASDLGVNDTTYYIRSHLGGILHPGDSVMGYDLTTANFNHPEWDQLKEEEIPDVVLVKKVYPEKQKKRKTRLQRMAKEYNEDPEDISKKGAPTATRDYQEFLQELENDDELHDELYFEPEEENAVLAADELDAAESY